MFLSRSHRVALDFLCKQVFSCRVGGDVFDVPQVPSPDTHGEGGQFEKRLPGFRNPLDGDEWSRNCTSDCFTWTVEYVDHRES